MENVVVIRLPKDLCEALAEYLRAAADNEDAQKVWSVSRLLAKAAESGILELNSVPLKQVRFEDKEYVDFDALEQTLNAEIEKLG